MFIEVRGKINLIFFLKLCKNIIFILRVLDIMKCFFRFSN